MELIISLIVLFDFSESLCKEVQEILREEGMELFSEKEIDQIVGRCLNTSKENTK